MSIEQTIVNPVGNPNKLNITQTNAPTAVGFIEPGGSLVVTIDENNSATLSLGDLASTGPNLPGDRLGTAAMPQPD